MIETECINKFMEFGLTRQEATIYQCLLLNGELTGYEAAKLTGISRSNVYSALAGLTEKGATYLMEGNVSKYTPISVEEFCDNKMQMLQECKQYLMENVKSSEVNEDGYITIQGQRHIRNKIKHCLEHAEYRVYFYAPKAFLESWQEEIGQLLARKIKVVLMSEEDVTIEGSIFYKTIDPIKDQLRLIIDSKYVLTGSVKNSPEDTCLYSGQENFVQVFKDALRNEIKLIELTYSSVQK